LRSILEEESIDDITFYTEYKMIKYNLLITLLKAKIIKDPGKWTDIIEQKRIIINHIYNQFIDNPIQETSVTTDHEVERIFDEWNNVST
jgi:hypothetical protein